MNATAGRTLRAVLEHRASNSPGKTFVIYDDMAGGVTPLSYEAFDQQVNRAAHLLRELGLGVGKPFRRTTVRRGSR